MNVPDGFAITAATTNTSSSTNQLQTEINSQLQFLEPDDFEWLYASSAGIQQKIVSASMPPDLEVAIDQAYGNLMTRIGKRNQRVSPKQCPG